MLQHPHVCQHTYTSLSAICIFTTAVLHSVDKGVCPCSWYDIPFHDLGSRTVSPSQQQRTFFFLFYLPRSKAVTTQKSVSWLSNSSCGLIVCFFSCAKRHPAVNTNRARDGGATRKKIEKKMDHNTNKEEDRSQTPPCRSDAKRTEPSNASPGSIRRTPTYSGTQRKKKAIPQRTFFLLLLLFAKHAHKVTVVAILLLHNGCEHPE